MGNMLGWDEIAIRLVVAAVFVAAMGLERERKNWAAGMRTHMMVCVGSTLIMMVSAYGFFPVLGDHVTLDPSRVAAQVVSGIGFIGAGTILFLKQGFIRGLTTASGLWTVAAIGLATGGGMYYAAAVTTVLALIILWALQPLEKYFSKRFTHRTISVVTRKNSDPRRVLKQLWKLEAKNFSNFTLDKTDGEFVIQLKFENVDSVKLEEMISILQADPGIKEVTWNK